ncbi:hypothetical protein [Chloroflexus sp.]|uniref:hypothetical protein n=1 Tax=Chloroflexus sp. TaxID=1904827 RepID=UPI00261D7380|nr:hypothetical protein [uncultured Chloroflexus sp.]
MLSRLFLPGKSVDISSFESKFIKPWESIHGPLPGRIDANATRQALERWTPTEPIRALVVSSIEDVHLCLFANGLPQRLGLGLVNPDHPVSPSQARWIEQAQRDPRLPIVFLHDASVAGCLLRYLVSAQWGLTPDHRIIDVGLRPNDARDRQLPWTYVKTPPALKQFFDRLASQPDTLDLERDEIEWLRADATASVLYLPPAQLLRLVTQAVAQHAPQVVDPEAEAQAQARAVGFMTWPQPVAR